MAIRHMLIHNARRQKLAVMPPNCIIMIADVNGGTSPELDELTSIWSTTSCVIIGCMSLMDGSIELTLMKDLGEDRAKPPTFDRAIATPNRELVISTSEEEVLLRSDVPRTETRLRIWTNHETEPDVIDIVFS